MFWLPNNIRDMYTRKNNYWRNENLRKLTEKF